MNETETKPKRPYFRPTTPAQRRLLFETYEATHDVSEACTKAHVGQGTYYYWRPRFETEGYEGLDHERSRAPHRTRIAPIAPEIGEEVVAYKRAHPAAGYRTVAQRVRQAHDWQPVIGPSKVRLILLEAGLVKPAAAEPAAAAEVSGVHAPEPEQTVNIDLCVVPISHEAQAELISASLGAVVNGDFSPSDPDQAERSYPGQVFTVKTSDYAAQMNSYSQQRTAKRQKRRRRPRSAQSVEQARLRIEAAEVCNQRRRQRLARQEADALWQQYRRDRQTYLGQWRKLSRTEKRQL